jgi:DNA-binding GntR family transcriptional regulator
VNAAGDTPNFRTLARTSITDEVVDQLRNMILSLELPPRTRLRQEEVAAKLGISRTPVREALRILQYEGLVIPVAGGASVEVVELSDDDAKDLYQVRAPIDGLAARLCAEHPDRLPLDELERDLETLESAAEPFDVRTFTTAHTRFHVGLVRGSGNKRLEQTLFIVQLSSLMLYPKYMETPERMTRSAHEHRPILEQIKAGDPKKAEEVAIGHIENAANFWFGERLAAD